MPQILVKRGKGWEGRKWECKVRDGIGEKWGVN